MKHEQTADDFHNDGSAEILALYNACNGVLLNGRLDISKLEDYSPDDALALDIPRLRKIWTHSAGCTQCDRVISFLNEIRGTMQADSADAQSLSALRGQESPASSEVHEILPALAMQESPAESSAEVDFSGTADFAEVF